MNIKTEIMEESRIKETLIYEINGHQVEVLNDGIKKMEDQSKESIPALIELLTKDVTEGKTTGWFPYANFEASITWSIIGRKLTLEELKKRWMKESGVDNTFNYWNNIIIWWNVRGHVKDGVEASKCTTTDLQKICLLSELGIDCFGNQIEE